MGQNGFRVASDLERPKDGKALVGENKTRHTEAIST